jgi:hypothetical protein
MTIFNTQTFSRTRITGKTISSTTGIVSAGTSSTSSGLTGNIQPAGKKEIERLPEGLQSKESILIITTNELRINDTINYNSVDFSVAIVENFTGHLSIGQYEAIAVKKDNQGI